MNGPLAPLVVVGLVAVLAVAAVLGGVGVLELLNYRVRRVLHARLRQTPGVTEHDGQFSYLWSDRILAISVDSAGRIIVSCPTPGQPPLHEALPLRRGVPIASREAVWAWSSLDDLEAAAETVLTFSDALQGIGRWKALAQSSGLECSLSDAGLPTMSGRISQREVLLTWTGISLRAHAEVDPSIVAKRGRGHSGNPVLDLCIDSINVPASLTDSALAVVHGGGGLIADGQLEVPHWQRGPDELLCHLHRLMEYQR